MKTISEMQSQIKEMSSKLGEFAIALSDYNQSENRGDTIDFKQIKAIGIRNPLTGHILEKADTSVKKKYITMLIAIAYMAKEKQKNAWLLIQRIAAGANFIEELIDLIVDAINITDGQLYEFTLNIESKELTNAFVLDAMLIYLSCENKNSKMLEFLSALFELVKCGKKEVDELSDLAVAIAEQDRDKYIHCKAGKNNNIEVLCFVYTYVKNFVKRFVYLSQDGRPYFITYTKIDDIIKVGKKENKPLMWRVIGKEDGKSLLLCEQSVGNMETSTDWNNSPIRTFLNGDFYKNTFSDEEKCIICTGELQDKVFLLSGEEVEKYMQTEQKRKSILCWWLRSHDDNDYVWSVSSAGSFDIYNYFGYEGDVRPAFWINL